MRFHFRRRSRESGSVLVLFTLMLPTMLIPLAGLAIDASVVRVVQLRLQAAVDGAALGAGRLLGTPAIPETLAAEFLLANFRTDNSAGTWGAHHLVHTEIYTPGITKRIDIEARAQVPLLFMRIFGFANATVAAAGSGTRSDSRVVFVIDRSGSMGPPDNVIVPAKNLTAGLVQKFMANNDELGLVAFDGSAVVGYPSGVWTSAISLASTGGPNKAFKDGSANDMPAQIAAITPGSGTGMADALSIAYIEIQKAHMRDFAADGVDVRLNTIILLTDGVPSAVSLYLNDPSGTNANNIIRATSGCTYKTINPPTPANMMKSWFAISGPTASGYSGSNPFGMYLLASTDPNPAHTSRWWMGHGGSDAASSNPATPYEGCPGLNNGNTAYNYFSRIPDKDLYGNALNPLGSPYTNSHIVGGLVDSIYTGTPLDQNQEDKNYHWGLAMWNAVDDVARRIRVDSNLPNRIGDTSGNMNIQIYVIGYTGNGGCDDGLLKRVANDMAAAGYQATQPRGKYYSAANAQELADAYNRLASDLLRLAK